MGFLGPIIGILGEVGKTVAEHFFPNPADELKRQELQQQLQIAVLNKASEMEQAAAEIVKTEAASSHWLAANWRPITMLIFVSLIVARWFGYSAPGLGESEILELWAIVKIGLGGYVVGRSVEKVAPVLADAVKGRK